MRIRTPSYYRQFRCTASACGESCCVGWDICIDPETAGRYRTLSGGKSAGRILPASAFGRTAAALF